MKKLYSIAACLVTALVVSQSALAVETSTGYNYVVENTFGKTESELVPVPIAYEYLKTIKKTEANGLNNPRDLYFDHNDNLFVADTGNSRILKISTDGEILEEYTSDGNGKDFLNPEGVFVDNTGAIYIADTGNSRIVHLSAQGKFVENFTKPTSELLGESFTFNPRKVFVDNAGMIYLIQQDSLLTIDAYNKFKGYIGETKIGFNLLLTITKFFASDTQRALLGAPVRPSFMGMDYSDDGYVYATTNDLIGQIRKINTIGRNLFPVNEYGEKYYRSDGMRLNPDFIDIVANPKGIVSVLDANLGRVYQYDQDGNNLCVFGSGKTPGRGQLTFPVAIETDKDDNIYILDSAQAVILVYAPTEFIRLVHSATNAYEDGRYDEVTEYSNRILELNSNYSLAHYFMGKSYYKKKQWEESMKQFKLAENRLSYSNAYEKKRLDISLAYFPVILFASILLIVLIYLAYKKVRKKADLKRDHFIYGESDSIKY